MTMSTPVRRSFYVVVLLLILAGGAYYLREFLDDTEKQDEVRAEATASAEAAPEGIVTDTFAADITKQYIYDGGPVTVVCPPRIVLRKDAQMTCQVSGPAGEPLLGAVVTIKDPGAAKGARWVWVKETPAP